MTRQNVPAVFLLLVIVFVTVLSQTFGTRTTKRSSSTTSSSNKTFDNGVHRLETNNTTAGHSGKTSLSASYAPDRFTRLTFGTRTTKGLSSTTSSSNKTFDNDTYSLETNNTTTVNLVRLTRLPRASNLTNRRTSPFRSTIYSEQASTLGTGSPFNRQSSVTYRPTEETFDNVINQTSNKTVRSEETLLSTSPSLLYRSTRFVRASPATPRRTTGPVQGMIHLEGGVAAGTGNVIIYYGGSRWSICDDGWNLQAARVACRAMGFPNALGHTSNSYFGPPQYGK